MIQIMSAFHYVFQLLVLIIRKCELSQKKSVVEALHEDLGTISRLFMLVDFHAAFVMLSLFYAQRLSYLLHTMFPSPCILQHYVKFDTCTITTSQRLICVRFFGGSICHLTRQYPIILVFLGRLRLLFVVQIAAPTFLGCWALITLALIICFQQDDHHIFFDVVTHVETNIFMF
jgi:hypothetical protein